MKEQFSRTAALYGDDAVKRLICASVLLFGVGGVGSYVAESLARVGIGHICIVDPDEICESNLNRQAQALHSTLGQSKADVMAARMKDINPDISVDVRKIFYLPESAESIDFSEFDYVADAVDTVSAKIEIITRAKRLGVPVISCMGTGNKTRPELLEITDIYKTEGCPLARVMRRELRARSVESLDVVFSREEPKKSNTGLKVPSSSPFVPNSAGLLMASEIVRNLLKI